MAHETLGAPNYDTISDPAFSNLWTLAMPEDLDEFGNEFGNASRGEEDVPSPFARMFGGDAANRSPPQSDGPTGGASAQQERLWSFFLG
jgi:hypothetical protein